MEVLHGAAAVKHSADILLNAESGAWVHYDMISVKAVLSNLSGKLHSVDLVKQFSWDSAQLISVLAHVLFITLLTFLSHISELTTKRTLN